MRTKKNLLFHTWIGLKVEVLSSSDAGLQGLGGTIVDETKNTLVLDTSKGVKNIPKISCVFRFFCDDKSTADVVGAKVCFRHFERPKKVL